MPVRSNNRAGVKIGKTLPRHFQDRRSMGIIRLAHEKSPSGKTGFLTIIRYQPVIVNT
jgi:hypothetical protein